MLRSRCVLYVVWILWAQISNSQEAFIVPYGIDAFGNILHLCLSNNRFLLRAYEN